jgi:hypothetical protein
LVDDGAGARETALDRPDRVDALIDFLAPVIEDLLRRVEGEEFSTAELISVMEEDPAAAAAYRETLRRWGEGERYARMVVHGQVIPGVLRRSRQVEWVGFAHGDEDDYAVPALWRIVRS